MHGLKAALAVSTVLAFTAPSSAATLAFSYDFANGNTLSGTADGTLATDGNLFTVSTLNGLAVNGTSVASDYRVTAFDYTQNDPAILSLDGSYLNLVLSRSVPVGYDLYLAFQVGTPYAAEVAIVYPAYPNGVVAALPVLGGAGPGAETYVRANFSANLIDAVPEPASWAMMISGFGVVGGSLRRRRAPVSVRFA